MATRDPEVRAARGTLRWTGSWRTAFVTRRAGRRGTAGRQVFEDVRTDLDIMRMAGVDLEVEPAVIVGLKIALKVCLKGGYFRSDVQRALMDRFTSGTMHNGKPGLLDPANFSFGQTIYLSPFIAAAQSVEGVAVGAGRSPSSASTIRRATRRRLASSPCIRWRSRGSTTTSAGPIAASSYSTLDGGQ